MFRPRIYIATSVIGARDNIEYVSLNEESITLASAYLEDGVAIRY